MGASCPRCGLPRPKRDAPCAACGHASEPASDPGPAEAPPAPSNAWRANAPRGPNRALIGLLLAIPLGFAALVTISVAINWDRYVTSFQEGLAAGLRVPRPPDGSEQIARVGQVVDLVDATEAELGSVTVTGTTRPDALDLGAPPSGFRYVAAQVVYEARSSWSYSTLEWSARDEQQHRYDSLPGAPPPALGDGNLAAGDDAGGWLAFLIPEDTTRLWLDFIASDGSIVFTVQIDGSPAEPPSLPGAPPETIT